MNEEETTGLFRRLEGGDLRAQSELVEGYEGLVRFFVKRYRNRGAESEDLLQVARLALVKAIDRFDPERGFRFSTFAGRTIDGELKRYFRDRTWSVRVPRSVQERSLSLRTEANRFEAVNGRAPTAQELADVADMDLEDVIEALDAARAYNADSLDRPRPGGDGSMGTVGDRIGGDDVEQERAGLRVAVDQLLDILPDREREIIELRFHDELTQSEIAERIGISQMHVSRLLRRSLEQLREQLRG